MQLHGNAALTPNGRLRLARRVVEERWSLGEAAAAAEVSERTARKWVDRYLADGEAGLADRSSAPRSQPGATPRDRLEAIAALRRLRMTGAEIAEGLSMALSTVQGILTRIGLGELSRLEPPEPPNRYERDWPGELIHIDVKKLGGSASGAPATRATGNRGKGQHSRGAGWEFVHICIDDATRLAYVELLPDEKAATCVGFLKRALRFYRAHGVKVARLMTDNGSAYRSTLHAIACRALKIKHIRTKPYRPRTNGKAERFIRTLLAGGPTAPSTAPRPRRPPPCPAGSTSTIAADHTAPSATKRPWSASRRSNRGTTSPVLTPSLEPGTGGAGLTGRRFRWCSGLGLDLALFLGGAHLDPAGLRLRRHGQREREHAAFVVRLDVLSIDAGAEPQLAAEPSLRPLGDDDLVVLPLLEATLGRNAETLPLDGDTDRVGIDAGQVEVDTELVSPPVGVHGEASRCTSAGEQLGGHLLELSEWVVADSHLASSRLRKRFASLVPGSGPRCIRVTMLPARRPRSVRSRWAWTVTIDSSSKC
jgi:transposase